MTGRELFGIWAPSGSTWSQWVSPVLFAQIDCKDENVGASLAYPAIRWHEQQANAETAVVIDLPGAQSIRVALDLAERGYRPVPIINSSPSPDPFFSGSPQSVVVLDMSSLVKDICIGTARLQQLTLASDAPPAFILDAVRLKGTNPLKTEMFDNRWMVFPQDFPSARFLTERKIKRVTLVQSERAQPLEDLSHVLLRWQEAGIEILAKKTGEFDAPSRIIVSRPSRFKASWYRALSTMGLRRSSVGGFGSFIPEPFAAG